MEQKKPMFSNRQLFQLLWPLIIEQLLNVLVGMIDVLMVAAVGEAAVSGVSLVDSVNILLIQVLAALTAGGTVVCSQYIGAKNKEKASKTAGQLVMLTVGGTLVVVVLFLVFGRHLLALIFGQVDSDVMGNAYTYFIITTFSFPFLALYNSGAALFRAMGNSRISMKVSMFMNGLNVAGNALCIFVLKMGVSGVALPTLTARMTAAMIIMTLLQRSDGMIRIQGISDMRPEGSLIRRILSIGIPSGMESGMFQFGKLMLQSLVSTLGTAAIAGYAVAGNLVTYLYLPGNALGLAMVTIVGQCLGANEVEQAKNYTKKLVFLDYAMLAVLSTVLIAGRGFFVGMYSLSPEASKMAIGLLVSHCIAMILWPPAFLMPYSFRAGYDAKFTMVIAVASMWIFRVGLAYIFVKIMHFPVLFVWIAMYIDWIFRFFVFIWRFRGYSERVQVCVNKL